MSEAFVIVGILEGAVYRVFVGSGGGYRGAVFGSRF